MILTPVNANRNPFIYLNNMGKVMTSDGASAFRDRVRAAVTAGSVAGAIALAAAFPVGSVARAETGAWVGSAHAKARLVAAVPATGMAESVPLGLEIELAPGWKTYWRSPGEGGLPPRFDWRGSINLAGVAIAWPAPKRFEIGGMESVGYSDRVILPLEARLARPGAPLGLKLALHYAVCREICMLVEANLALDLPAAAPHAGERSAHAGAIAGYRARVPRPGAKHGWRVAGISRRAMGTGAERREVIVIDIASAGAPFSEPALMLESTDIRFGKAMRKAAAGTGQARFVAPMERIRAGEPDADIVLTLIDGERAGTFTLALPR